MAYKIPEFNLVCDVYRGPWATRVLALEELECNLAYSRRQQTLSPFPAGANETSVVMSLLVPAGSDLRDLSCAAVQDVVECPSGSGRWYQVSMVDDIGKGFDNEHRCASLFKISEALIPTGNYTGLLWPAPIP